MQITLRLYHGTIPLLLVVGGIEAEALRPLLAIIKREDSMYHHHLIKVSMEVVVEVVHPTVVVSSKMNLSNWIIYLWQILWHTSS
jgi:hypothetical protein